jgi:histone-lysine N-methyltransferase SETMAR
VLSVCLETDKTEYHAFTKFFVKEGLTPNEIHSKFIKVYGDSSPSFSTIKKWAAEFKRGRTSIEDDPREGRPKSATTPEIIEQVHDMVLDDRRMKVLILWGNPIRTRFTSFGSSFLNALFSPGAR